MNPLLDPNFAYLFLVTGVLLTLLAIVAPGTGMLEIGALFCLALAGYGVYYLKINLWAPILLILSIIPFVYAIRGKRREVFLILSILGVVVGSVFLFTTEDGKMTVNPILAIITSALTGGFLWLVVNKTLQAHLSRPRHDLSTLLGQIGEAKTRIQEEGSVQAAGELWTARSEKVIPMGSRVRIIGKDGFVLIVEIDKSSDSK
jgi:membrane-bound serine protease (ClpP class)